MANQLISVNWIDLHLIFCVVRMNHPIFVFIGICAVFKLVTCGKWTTVICNTFFSFCLFSLVFCVQCFCLCHIKNTFHLHTIYSWDPFNRNGNKSHRILANGLKNVTLYRHHFTYLCILYMNINEFVAVNRC